MLILLSFMFTQSGDRRSGQGYGASGTPCFGFLEDELSAYLVECLTNAETTLLQGAVLPAQSKNLTFPHPCINSQHISEIEPALLNDRKEMVDFLPGPNLNVLSGDPGRFEMWSDVFGDVLPFGSRFEGFAENRVDAPNVTGGVPFIQLFRVKPLNCQGCDFGQLRRSQSREDVFLDQSHLLTVSGDPDLMFCMVFHII